MITLHTTLLLLAFITGWQVEHLPDPTIEAVIEWQDMMDRHPEFVNPPSVAPRVAQSWTGDVESWRPLVSTYFKPADVEWALAVIRCESSGVPTAWNRSTDDRGLFQHHYRYWADRSTRAGYAGGDPFDPETNVAVASWLFYTGGASHWNPSASCWG